MTSAFVVAPPNCATPDLALAGFDEHVRDYTPYVWRVLRSLGVRDADLEDVCQETFIVVLRRLPTFEGRSSMRSWIYGIALRVVSDYRNKAHRRCEVLSPELPESISSPQQEAALERQRAWQRIDQLLERLSQEQREVFILYELEQMNMREVSATIGCPLQTAYSRLHAARKIVQDTLKRMRAAGVER